MALSIKDAEADRLVRTYAKMRQTSYTQAIRLGMNEAIDREKARAGAAPVEDFVTRVRRIGEAAAKLPILDPRSAEEIIGYDENGLP